MIDLITAAVIAAVAPVPAAPQRHCGIETRVWCLSSGNFKVGMTLEGSSRVWTVLPLEWDGAVPITVSESASCDLLGNHERPKFELSETTDTRADKVRRVFHYTMASSECRVDVSWESTPLQSREARRAALDSIWLGWPDEKTDLFHLRQNLCHQENRLWDDEKDVCGNEPLFPPRAEKRERG